MKQKQGKVMDDGWLIWPTGKQRVTTQSTAAWRADLVSAAPPPTPRCLVNKTLKEPKHRGERVVSSEMRVASCKSFFPRDGWSLPRFQGWVPTAHCPLPSLNTTVHEKETTETAETTDRDNILWRDFAAALACPFLQGRPWLHPFALLGAESPNLKLNQR